LVAYFRFDCIAHYIENPNLISARKKEETGIEEEYNLFPRIREEYSFCVYCGYRLTKESLCRKCDLGVEMDPDEYEVLF